MSTKIKCILLDDEMPGLTYLKMLCEQFSELEIVRAFNDPQRLLKESQDIDFELCILDIEMPQINGLQVADLLRDKMVIFTTAYSEHAADAFDLNAIDYVRKPVRKERLHQAVKKAVEHFSEKRERKEFIQLNTDKGKSIIYFHQLAYITASESDSRDKIAVMHDASSLLLKNISFENLNKVLPQSLFCRINKKQIISLSIVTSYTFNEITSSILSENGLLRFSLTEVYRPQFQKLTSPAS
jgi:DNA-binding LytR/AlgR family response regulator